MHSQHEEINPFDELFFVVHRANKVESIAKGENLSNSFYQNQSALLLESLCIEPEKASKNLSGFYSSQVAYIEKREAFHGCSERRVIFGDVTNISEVDASKSAFPAVQNVLERENQKLLLPANSALISKVNDVLRGLDLGVTSKKASALNAQSERGESVDGNCFQYSERKKTDTKNVFLGQLGAEQNKCFSKPNVPTELQSCVRFEKSTANLSGLLSKRSPQSKDPIQTFNYNGCSSQESKYVHKNHNNMNNHDYDIVEHSQPKTNSFVSARSKFNLSKRQNNSLQNNSKPQANNTNEYPYRNGNSRKRFRRGRGGFKPPAPLNGEQRDKPNNNRGGYSNMPARGYSRNGSHSGTGFRADKAIKRALQDQEQGCGMETINDEDEANIDPRLKGLDPAIIERIESEVLQEADEVKFDDIAGLDFAKQSIEEIVIWPIKNPEYYTGLRQLPKGLLLFGPPGTGKTLIGKAIAHEVSATFFSISASSLTSKWIGEGEKTVRCLFGVAAVKQPSVIFIDEIDSLLCQRSSDENEASRRIKTEFLVQLDGAGTKSDEMILVIGATNRPQELDEAARRRFVKRLYIPLPDEVTRTALFQKLLKKNDNCLNEEQVMKLVELTKGYSGADVTNLAREASMGPLRDKMRSKERDTSAGLRHMEYNDFIKGLRSIRASVSDDDLKGYQEWNTQFGSTI